MPRQPNGAGPGEFLYTPQLTATTTDPDLGTGGSATGGWRYVSEHLVFWWALILFGTSPDPGAGYYQISLPVDPITDNRGVGEGMIIDTSASSEVRPVRVCCASALATALSAPDLPFIFDTSAPAAITSALVGAESPFTWAAVDQINVSGLYQVT